MNTVLSTNNVSKTEQVLGVFEGSPVKISTLKEAGITGKPIENGSTAEENAEIKARFAWDALKEKTWTMADDTIISITALNGRPGIYAARWAGENAKTKDITRHTLKQLEGKMDRSAYFETFVVVISPQGEKYVFSGKVWGIILTEPRSEPQPDMPYSPIFVPIGSDKVWAEMTVEEENAISHRGIAFREARKFLELQLSVAA